MPREREGEVCVVGMGVPGPWGGASFPRWRVFWPACLVRGQGEEARCGLSEPFSPLSRVLAALEPCVLWVIPEADSKTRIQVQAAHLRWYRTRWPGGHEGWERAGTTTCGTRHRARMLTALLFIKGPSGSGMAFCRVLACPVHSRRAEALRRDIGGQAGGWGSCNVQSSSGRGGCP